MDVAGQASQSWPLSGERKRRPDALLLIQVPFLKAAPIDIKERLLVPPFDSEKRPRPLTFSVMLVNHAIPN